MNWYVIGLQQLINGLALGSIYALIALGYTMVYGIIKLINFAHGEIYMLGAYLGYYAITSLSLSLVPAMVLAMVSARSSACCLKKLLIGRYALRPASQC